MGGFYRHQGPRRNGGASLHARGGLAYFCRCLSCPYRARALYAGLLQPKSWSSSFDSLRLRVLRYNVMVEIAIAGFSEFDGAELQRPRAGFAKGIVIAWPLPTHYWRRVLSHCGKPVVRLSR